MSTVDERVAVTEVPTRGDELRRSWPWFVLLGVALTAVGFVALWSPWVTSHPQPPDRQVLCRCSTKQPILLHQWYLQTVDGNPLLPQYSAF